MTNHITKGAEKRPHPDLPDHDAAAATTEEIAEKKRRDAEFFADLRALELALGRAGNQNDKATILIQECIAYGINTGKRIIGALAHVGLNKQHVGLTLRHGSGTDPRRHWWTQNTDGTYTILERVELPSCAHITVPPAHKPDPANA